MFQAMILMICGATFISRATESDMLTNITDAHLNTKYSDFLSFKDVLFKENFDSFKPLILFKLIKWCENTCNCVSPEAGHKEQYGNSYPAAC